MPTDANKCAALYSATTRLAYSISMLAITPRPPFAVADQETLYAKSTDIADAAKHLRGRDPNDMENAKVDEAALSVKKTQVMLDTIDVNLDNQFSKQSVIVAIDKAATQVNTL
jgi:hypothetical protein